MVEVIREFDCEREEDSTTYKWSFDGSYLAKKFTKEQEKDGKTKIKEGLSVYTLPSMQLLVDSQGQKKSITVEGITDWEWSPIRNLVVFTSFSKTVEGQTQIDPKVGFLKIPERKVVSLKSIKNSESLKLVLHPQGYYLAVINEYHTKKSTQYSVELFDINDTRSDFFP